MAISSRTRWVQLCVGIACMVMIANLQYGWTLFVLPIADATRWARPAIQVAFTIFIVTETWLLPAHGILIDRIGPRPIVMAGGVLIAASWMLNSVVASLTMLYIAAAIGGIGAGMIYAACVGNAVKWFPDRRGLAAGLTAAGFGAGSALTVIPIASWITDHGYQSAFFNFGLAQGAIVLVASLWLRAPATKTSGPIGPTRGAAADLAPLQVLRHPAFWLMYLMFVLVGAGGLMATAQLAVIAADYGVARTSVDILGITLPALTFALSLDRVLNGLTRPFFGWVSDQIGREVTMFIAFVLESAGICALVLVAHDPVAFVLVSGLVFFAWGEIYSLFPATCADYFGSRHAAANYGMLYTAKGTAALIVPVAGLIGQGTRGWTVVFAVAALCNLVAALLALFVLKPLRPGTQVLSSTRLSAAP